MAELGRAGNVSEVSEEEMNQSRGFKLLEPGWYRCVLQKDKVSHYGWGTGLNMEFQIITGDYENQRIFEFLCVEHNESEKAQHIARVKLKEFATAAGHKGDTIERTDPLYGKPVMVEVYRAKDDTQYAEEDGKKPRIGQFMSCEQWKAEKADEPMPGVSRKKAEPAKESAPPPPPDDDDDIPF